MPALWATVPPQALADTMAAFAAVRTAADVTGLGPVKADGKTYYQVSFRSAIMHPLLIPAGNLTETALTTPKLTLLLDPTGRPVRGAGSAGLAATATPRAIATKTPASCQIRPRYILTF